MPSKSTGERPLEQMGISAESELPDGIKTPAEMKSVRFTVSTPGYHFVEVEKYKETVDETLDAYADLLHKRDLDIHKLDESLARANVDLLNKNSQIEVLVAQNGMAQEAKNDEEVETLLQANQALKEEIKKLNQEHDITVAQLTDLETYVAQLDGYVADLEEQNAAFLNGTNSVTADDEEQEEEEVYEVEEAYSVPEDSYVYEEPEALEEEPEEEYTTVPPAPVYVAPLPRKTAPKIVPAEVTKKFPGIRPEDLE